MPPDQPSDTTLPAIKSGIKEASEPRRTIRRWTPIDDDDHPGSLPIDWICPCTADGTTLRGNKTCPKCGRSPLDQSMAGVAHLDGPQHIAHSRNSKRWKKFAKAAGRQ
jgi:hypothetical protein